MIMSRSDSLSRFIGACARLAKLARRLSNVPLNAVRLDFEAGVWQNSTMNSPSKLLSSASTLAVVFFLGALGGFAQNQHPAYLRALTDLRHARAHLQRPVRGELRVQEREAIREIDEAIGEIKRAAIDDGKDLNAHPPVDAKLDWPGRLHRALELINKAHGDISREEDNRFAQGLQQRALRHLDGARRHVEEAIAVVRSR